ncbi:MAG: hypothetical protein GYA33_03415 [Thermogutta sp.]|nr:hypothetical protein [Thermogutta sp.]
MAQFRSSSRQHKRSFWETLWNRRGRSEGKKRTHKHRRLRLDALEERTLLSVTPVDALDKLVNQSLIPSSDGGTIAGQSIAVDNDGDFVVAWSRADTVIDPFSGNPVLDPLTGQPQTEWNVYARYLTDEVQRITLPGGVLNDTFPSLYGQVSLIYGGTTLVQRLNVTATQQPYTFLQQNIQGTFALQADTNGDGIISPTERATIVYDETVAPDQLAAKIQAALQGLGGPLQNTKVTAVSSGEFLIEYGSAALGVNQPKLAVDSPNFTSGFYPNVAVTTVRQPTLIANIPVSPSNPQATATAIEQAFNSRVQSFPLGPIDFPPPDRVPSAEGPYSEPITAVTARPRISVTAVSATEFDVRFVGDSGKEDHPELIIAAVTDELGNNLLPSAQAKVVTLKQSSPEFRVNPDEPDDPFTPGPDKYDQINPAVAIDADGDFVIVWEGEVPDSEIFGSVTDIFARRYRPAAMTDPDFDGIPGVEVVAIPDTESIARVDAFTFRANDETTRPQFQPAVGMDDVGNFVIAWANGAQDFSFFNGIKAQIFNRKGERVGTEFLVSTEETAIQFDPSVGMSHDGNFVIAWDRTDDVRYLTGGVFTSAVFAKAYDPSGQVLLNQFGVGGGGSSTVAFDSANHFLISWAVVGDADNTGQTTPGVRAIMYELVDALGNPTGTVLRDTFRPNSASLTTDGAPLWPGSQEGAQAGLDADGDIVISYEGYGPDVSTDAFFFANTLLQQQINATTNSDLLTYFDPSFEFFPVGYQNNGDVDGALEEILVRAVNRGANAEQIGRLRAILDGVAGLLRGEADGIMFSRFDADPNFNVVTLFSDSIANAYRDGHNERYFIVMDRGLNWESFQVRLYRGGQTGYENLTIDNLQINNVWSLQQTIDRIDAVLEGAVRTGVNWAETAYEGPIDVRLLSFDEILNRQGTPWEVTDGFGSAVDPFEYAVFEVTFQGEGHDWPFYLIPNPGAPGRAGGADVAPPQIVEYMPADEGTTQTAASLGVTPDGSFVVAWTQWERATDGTITNSTIRYRQFLETLDTAGPIVSDIYAPDGQAVDGSQLVTPDGVQYLVINFDEEMLAFDDATLAWAIQQRDQALANGQPVPASAKRVLDSVTNPENYRLSKDGVLMGGAVTRVQFGMNKAAELAAELGLDIPAANKWQAVLEIDANPGEAGLQPLDSAAYTLEVLAPVAAGPGQTEQSGVRDKAGNPLGRTGFNPNGGNHTLDFRLLVGVPGPGMPGTPGSGDVDAIANTTLLDNQTAPAVAMNNNGDYVVVWVSPGQGGDTGTTNTNIIAQRYNRRGEPEGPEFIVNTIETGNQVEPDVAMDDAGNFVVVWSGEGDTDADGIWARVFDRFGTPQGQQFRVNQYRLNPQYTPKVAMDSVGNFVVTWSSYGQDFDSNAVIGRRYNRFGQALGDEFMVNVPNPASQRNSDVAMDDAGNFVVVWMSDGQDGNDWGVVARVFNADGTPRTGEILATQYRVNRQIDPRVAMDADGDFVITWSSFGQDGSGYGVLARRFAPDGTAKGDEFLVNQTALHWQYQSDVAMDKAGNFTITWTTMGQDNDLVVDWGIYARMFMADGNDYVLPPKGQAGEFRVNAETAGDQVTPVIAMDAVGNYVVAWTGASTDPDPLVAAANGTDIFTRLLDPPGVEPLGVEVAQLSLRGSEGDDVIEFIAGAAPENWTVKINGNLQAIPKSLTYLLIDGLGGRDTVSILATAGNDTAVVWADGAAVMFADLYRFQAENIESVAIDGRGGTDSLTVYDSPRVDTVTAYPGLLTISDAENTYSHTATNFEQVLMVSQAGGADVAFLNDSPGDDLFTGTPDYGELTGAGFRLRAEDFYYVHAYARNGGFDAAQLYDSTGDDRFVATPDYSLFDGSDFYFRAKFFDAVHAYSKNGGYDTALIKGSAGDDKVVLDAVQARLNSGSYIHRAKFFEEVTFRGNGGRDIAYATGGTVLPGAVPRGTSPVPTTAAEVAYLTGLYKINVTDEGGVVGKNSTIRGATDAVFTSFWL